MAGGNLWLAANGQEDDNLPVAQARLGKSYGINPEQAAKIDALAQRAKIPAAAAETQKDVLGAHFQAQDQTATLLAAPKTRAFVAQDQSNADLSHDHLDLMASVEAAWDHVVSIPRGVASALPAFNEGAWGTLAALAQLRTDTQRASRAAITGEAPAARPAGNADNVFLGLAQQSRATKEAVAGEQSTWLGRMLSGTAQSIGLQAPGMIAAIATKNPELATLPMATVVGGQAAATSLEQGNAGLDTARYGFTQGLAERVFEGIPVAALFKDLERGTGFGKMFLRQLAIELPTEVATTLVQNFDEWRSLNPEKSLGEWASEQPAAIRDTIAQVFLQTGAMTGTARIAQSVTDRIAKKDEQAQAAPAVAEAFDALVKDATAMPLRERSPERFHALMEQMAPGVDVHVPAEVLVTYLQSLDPEVAKTVVDGAQLAEQLQAATPGADIVIKAADYLTFVAPDGHSFLQKDIKLASAGMSVNEAEAHQGEREQLLADAAASALGTAVDGAPAAEARQRVYDDFYARSVAAGVPEEQAKANAAVQASYYEQRAARNTAFPDAWAAYQEAGVTIQGPNGQGAPAGSPTFNAGDQNQMTAYAPTTVAEMRPQGRDGHVENVFDFPSAQRADEVGRLYDAAEKDGRFSIWSKGAVPLDKVHTLQSSVETGKIAVLLKGYAAETDTKLPTVAKYEGQYYLTDGNHRAAVEKMRGKATMNARVIDLDAFLKTDGGATFEQSIDLRNKTETLQRFGLDPTKKHNTRAVAAALEARQRKRFGTIARDNRTPQARRKLARWMADEVKFELQLPGSSGVGWYSTKFQAALDIFADQFPELKTDQGARDTLTALIAITSDGQKVLPNFRQAVDLYANFRETGKFTTTRGHMRQDSVDTNVAKIQALYDAYGAKGMRDMLMQEATVRELSRKAKALGVDFSTSYPATAKMPYAAVIFGPKLGAFYANLMGAEGYLTMDRWWSRTFNRYRGTLLTSPTRQGLNRFRALWAADARLNKPVEEITDDELFAATVPYQKSYADKGFKNGTEIEKAANTLYKAIFENLEDQPFNGSDRAFMIETVAAAKEMLAKQDIDISVADIQAVLWYYEKRLYGDLGARQSGDVSYEETAQRVVGERAGPSGTAVPADGLADLGADVEASAPLAGEQGYYDPARDGAAGTFQQSVDADGMVTLSHWSAKGKIKQLDPARFGDNYEILSDEEKMTLDEAIPRTYWGVGTGQPGEYTPEDGIGPHRYEAKMPLAELYDGTADPQGFRAQAEAAVREDVGEEDISDYEAEVILAFEQSILDAGYKGYMTQGGSTHTGPVAAVFENPKHTYKGRDKTFAQTGGPTTIGTFKPENLGDLLSRDDWTIMTAENPAARTDLTPEENAALNLELEAELQRRGLEFHKVDGFYGQPEKSYIILGITETEAMGLGQQFSQESVLTRRGLVYGDGTYQPALGVKVHDTAPKDYYTYVPETGGLFTVNIDFDQRLDLPVDDTPGPAPGSKVQQVVYHGTPVGFEKFDLNAPRNFDAGGGRDNTDTGWFGKGVYFSPHKKMTSYAYTGRVDEGFVIPAYVNLQNPLRVDLTENESGATAMERAVVKAGGEFTQSPTKQTAEARRLGYDGVVVYRAGKLEEVVAFNPKQIKSAISNKVMGQGPRGQVSFSDQGALIQLFKTRNASTLIHEGAGHIWLENLGRDAADPNASDEVRADLELVKAWWRENAGLAGNEPAALQAIEDFGTGRPVDTDAIRPFHELFARAAERYFMEGKSPTPELRGAFTRFRNWLVAIYKDFTALKVPMTDDIRGVFDRLIAVPQELESAAQDQGLTPFFKDAASAGFTPAEYAAYLTTLKTADETAHDRLLGKVMGGIRRKYTAAWKAERETLVKKFQAQVDATPEMQALTLLESGEVRLQRDAVNGMAEGGEATLYRRQRPYVFDEGLHPDDVAEQVGLPSGQSLVDALVAMKGEHDDLRANGDKRTVRKARAERLADAEMLARHGDILNDGTIGDEAIAALNDLRRSEVLMAEVRALVRKAGAITTIWSQEEMQSWARAQVAARRLDGIRPHIYAAAEAKAGRDALKALVKDDFQGALDAKFRQLLNMHLFRAARDAREQIDKGKTLFERIAKAKNGTISKTRNMDMVGAARAVLTPYGFAAKANDADYMTKVRLYDPELWADLELGVTAALAGAKPIDELTYDEFASLREIVGQLWDMSRVSKQMEIDFQTLEIDDITPDLADQLKDPRVNLGPTHNATGRELIARTVQAWRAHMRRVESWVSSVDGGQKGPFRTYIWQPISDAATRYRLAKIEYLTAFVALLEPMRASLKRGKIEAPELNHVFGASNNGVGKSELLHAILHTGNESNKRKLLLGRQWATERADGTLDTTGWDQFIDRMHREGVLTQADYDFAQSVWDLLERMKPDAQKAHRRVFGRYFEEVTANSFNTPFGTYAGGYVPALVDPFIVQDAALKAGAEAVEEGNSANMFPSPARGFTKSRVEYNRPLALDLGLLPQHIDKVLKFTHMTAPVRDVLRLLKAKGLSAKLEAVDPTAVTDMLLPWLNRSARQVVETPSSSTAGRKIDSVLRAARSRSGMGIMMFNLSNTVQQLTGWFPASLRVKKRHLTRALWNYTRNTGHMADDIAAMSPFMATRTVRQMLDVGAELDNLLLDPSKYQQVADFSTRHAYALQGMFQNLVDLVTWQAAFEQAIEDGQQFEEAVRSADSAIRETQGSLSPEDVSAWETGGALKRMFTQFFSYFSAQGNLVATEMVNAKTLSRAGYVYLMGVLLPAVMSDIIRRSFGAGWDDDDDDGYLDMFLDLFFGSQFRYATGALPIVGQLVNLAANQFNDKRFDDQLVPSPAMSTVQSAASVPHDLYRVVAQGKGQKAAVRDTATLLTLVTGIPLFNVAARPLGYLADVNEGKVKPTGPVDLARGLMTGTASSASKVN